MPHQHEAGMGDRRIGQQPFHVGLTIGGQVAEGRRHGRDERQCRPQSDRDVQPRSGRALTSVSSPARSSASRASSTNAAPLEATDRKPATSAGAPSNTSGHQKWNGTTDSLNASPINRNSRPPTHDGLERRPGGRGPAD